jgi:apolipoprotein N-acyltransferase
MDVSRKHLAYGVLCTLVAGLVLRAGIGLAPPGWLAWVAPVPLLVLAYSIAGRARACAAVAVASLIAASHYSGYFLLVMPWPAAVLATCAQALVWFAIVMATRRVVRRLRNGWSVLAYPVLWVAVDTLMAALLPDGNWGSLAYSQADLLPLQQFASLFGTAGVLFVLCLVSSTLALLLWRGHRLAHPVRLAAAVALLLAAVLGFGFWRLQAPVAATPLRVGLASIDDPIGPAASSGHWRPIRDRYDALVAKLAADGAHLVLLPEKIAVLAPADLQQWRAHFGAIARQHRLWLAMGMTEDGSHPHNISWLFDPQGNLVEQYEKHFLAPPERAQQYARSDAFNLHAIDGQRYGLAICKDMHFARFGRAYGQREAAVMLVPAWDFAYRDGWLASRMTATRGIENGYAVVRAAREGLLTVSDAHGRMLVQARSAPLPGNAVIADLPVPARQATLYTRIGGLFGWLDVAAALGLLVVARRPRTGPAGGQRG